MNVASIFQDHMLLQRRKPVPVWGSADPGERVTVTLGKSQASAVTDGDGRWAVCLPAMEAAQGAALTLRTATEEQIIQDVAVGEVWLAGGQSDMEFPLRYDAKREAQYRKAPNPSLRYYCCPKISYDGQETEEDHSFEGVWRTATPENLPYFSAVGYYFQEKLHEALDGVPVGIVDCTWGGTSASCWMTDAYLTGDTALYLHLRDESPSDEAALSAYKERQKACNTPEMKAMMEKLMATPITAPSAFAPPKEEIEAFLKTKYAPFSPFGAGVLYRTMLSKVIPYAIKGFIWYQGEEDTNYPHLYTEMFSNMIRCWRDAWREELPFIFAQLPNFVNPKGWNPLDFVPIRKAQELAARQVANAYMACILDMGMPYDIHPKEKRPVGLRLANLALEYAYHLPVDGDAPSVTGVKKLPGAAEVTFSHCGKGLEPLAQTDALEVTVNELPMTYNAVISGSMLRVEAETITPDDRVCLRYAIRDCCQPFLFNSSHHPALPFEIVL